MKKKFILTTISILSILILILTGCNIKTTEKIELKTNGVETTIIETKIEETTTEKASESIIEETTSLIFEETTEMIQQEEEPITIIENIETPIEIKQEETIVNQFDEFQTYEELTQIYQEQEYYEEKYYDDYSYDGSVLTPEAGINYYNGILETYYNLPMQGVVEWMHSLGYGGEYWIRSDGVKMLGDYIMVAADYGWMPKGSIVQTSLGTGIVCDTGGGGWYWFDIAVTW